MSARPYGDPVTTLVAGRELDAMVAERVMGLHPCTFTAQDAWSAFATSWVCEHAIEKSENDQMRRYYPVGYQSKCYPSNTEAMNHPHSPLLAYSTSIAAAWAVVEYLHDQFYSFNLECCGGSCCATLSHTTQIGPNVMNEQEQSEYADTAPLAICLAALKALGVEVSS